MKTEAMHGPFASSHWRCTEHTTMPTHREADTRDMEVLSLGFECVDDGIMARIAFHGEDGFLTTFSE